MAMQVERPISSVLNGGISQRSLQLSEGRKEADKFFMSQQGQHALMKIK